MNLSAIIEVTIGIIFVWITLSLATIQIQEWITTKLDKRARDMEAAIHEMLANPNLKSQFYDHPVIRGLTAKKRKWPSFVPPRFYNHPLVRGFTQEKRRLPSYIPAQQFALSLFDIAVTAGTESSLIQQGILKIRDDLNATNRFRRDYTAIDALNILADLARSAAATEAGTAITNQTIQELKTKALQFAEEHPAYKKDILAALQQAEQHKKDIDEVLRNQPRNRDHALNQLKRGIAALSVISPEVNQTLNALLLNVGEYVSHGETNLARARKNVEQWFDDAMDRVSGVFKRYSQNMALIIGLSISLLANVDSISLTTYLWREPSVRALLASKANELTLSPPGETTSTGETNPYETIQNFTDQFTALNLPVGWTLKEKDDALFEKESDCAWSPKGKQYFGIPFFQYGLTNVGPLQNKCLMPSQPDHSTSIWLKLFGIAITAVAARQGAPFWFDILKRAVNLRSTGANPAEK